MIIKSFRIFESKLKYLESFENILKMMESPIAKHLVDISGKDLDLVVNFIGTGEEDDLVNFIPDKKSNEVKIVYHVVSQNGFFPDSREYQKVFTEYSIPNCNLPEIGTNIYIQKELDPTILVNIFKHWYVPSVYYCKSLDDKKSYLYLPHGNESISPSDKIIGPKSQQIRTGRLVKSLLKSSSAKFSDREVESFVNEFRSKQELMKNAFRNFHLVSGDEIPYWYSEDNYYKVPKGPLHSSCMRFNNCSRYLSIYSDNPKVCKLLILKSDFDQNKIVGRALVWRLNSGDSFMDRIYYSKESEVNLFIEYAKSNGWAYKSHQRTGRDGILMDGIPYSKDLKVKLDNYEFRYYPYVDTIKYLSSDGELSVVKGNKSKELARDDGSYIGACEECDNGRVSCDSCNGSGRDECYDCGGSGEVNCSTCDGDAEVDCSNCGGSREIDGETCPECDVDGKVDCPDCSRGKVTCDSCHGDGDFNCDDCNGEGTVPCSECSG